MKAVARSVMGMGVSLSVGAGLMACEKDGNEDAAAALEETVGALEAEGEVFRLGGLAFPRGVFAGQLPATAQERIDAIRAAIDARLDCADVSSETAGFRIEFRTDCTWDGTVWDGGVTITYNPVAEAATVEFEALKMNGATLDGTIEAVREDEGHSTLSADWTRVAADGRTLTGTFDAEYMWDDEAIEVVSAALERQVDGRTQTTTKTGLRWVRGEFVPEAGVIVFDGFRDNVWTMTFTRGADDVVVVAVTTPAGRVWTYRVDGNGRFRLTAVTRA